jgi:PAS domain S-box-containing protein
MAVDGPGRCLHVLKNIDTLSGVFLEMNVCRDACVNGPCSLTKKGDSIKATMDLRKYVKKDISTLPPEPTDFKYDVDLRASYPRLRAKSVPGTEAEITALLHKIGKFKPEDELNCGACGYSTCREKAWAVINGYADWDICLPFMREKAETMSYEIIHNSPEGIIVLDNDLNVIDINNKAKELLGITAVNLKGLPAVDFFNPSDFLIAMSEKRHIEQEGMYIPETKKYVDLSINLLSNNHALFGIMKDVTDSVKYGDSLSKMRMETLSTTDEVIKKQMRVAQEIASLLGETTAETKVALLKLKKTLQENEQGGE